MQKSKLWKIGHHGHWGVGGIFGMTSMGTEFNEYQHWLREMWDIAKKRVGIPNVLILGGECIEGTNPKGFQEDIWIPRKLDQINIAYVLAKEWIDPKITEEILILYGHAYHGSKEMRVEDILAQRLRDIGYNAKSGTLFERKYFGKVFRFIHGSSGSFVYRTSSKERQIKFNLEKSAMGKTPRFDQQYTYHTHGLYEAVLCPIRATSCPAWKLMDTWAQSRRPDAWLGDVGMLVTTIQERLGELRINNDGITFKPPFRFEKLEQSIKENRPRAKMIYQKVRTASVKTRSKKEVKKILKVLSNKDK